MNTRNCCVCCPADRSKALASMEAVFARLGLTPADVLASKKHTEAVLASTGEQVTLAFADRLPYHG